MVSLKHKRSFGIVLSLSIHFGLMAGGQSGVAQPPVPSDQPSSPGIAFQELTLGSYTSACPLPRISASESTINDLMGLASSVMVALFNNTRESDRFNVRGDGSDAGLHPRVNELLAQGNLAEAFALAQTLEDSSERNENLFAIGQAFNRRNLPDEARAVALALTETPLEKPYAPFSGVSSLRDQALFYVAQSYWNEGQLEPALELIDQMNEGAQLSPLLEISQRYWAQGQQAAAAATLEQATTVYQHLAARVETVDILQFWALARLLDGYTRFNQVEQRSQASALTSELFTLAQALPAQDYGTLSILTSAVINHIHANQPEHANTVLSYVLNNAEGVTEPYLKAILLAGVASQYAALGEGDRVTALMTEAQEVANTDDDIAQRNISSIIFSLIYYQMGQPDAALQVVDSVEPVALREQVKQALNCAESTPPPSQ